MMPAFLGVLTFVAMPHILRAGCIVFGRMVDYVQYQGGLSPVSISTVTNLVFLISVESIEKTFILSTHFFKFLLAMIINICTF